MENWLAQLLARMPGECANSMIRLHRKAGEELLRMDESAACVFFLLRGRVASINEQMGGLQYHFASFEAPAIFGEFEAFAGHPVYRSTLICESDCQLCSLPREAYLSWMRHDVESLYARTCAITASLISQARRERDSLFASAEQRLGAYIAMRCRQSTPVDGVYTLKLTMQQMADGIGSSVRTVQRALKHMAEMKWIRRKGRALLIYEGELAKLAVWPETNVRKEEKKP